MNTKSMKETPMKSESMKSQMNATVFLRIRSPIIPSYKIESNTFKIVNSEPERRSKELKFTSILKSDVMQPQVYNMCAENAIQNEENLTVLTYGTSGSGKTYTLLGEIQEPGLIPRAIVHIFSLHKENISATPIFKINKGEYSISTDEEIEMESKKRQLYFCNRNPRHFIRENKVLSEHRFEVTANAIFWIWISFVEIYNENVYDLLDIPKTNVKNRNLQIKSNGGKVFVSDLTSVLVTTLNEVSTLLMMGIGARQNGSTSINPKSSRSHCIFIVDVIKQERSQGITQTNYKFCDLGGTERLKKSDAEGARLKEANFINTSLMVLGRCLSTVHNNQLLKINERIPYRESKLTMLLQASLTGQEKLTMIANMLPIAEFHEENKNVLKFASMAQEIVYQQPIKVATRRSTFSKFFASAKTSNGTESNENIQLQLILDENQRLKEKVSQLLTERDNFETELHEINMRTKKMWQSEDEFVRREEFNKMISLKNKEIESLHEKIMEFEEDESEVDPIYADEPNVCEAVDILGCRTRNKKKEYLVNWKPSWIPSQDVTKQLKEEFKNKNKAGSTNL